jgi:hypothetical protein
LRRGRRVILHRSINFLAFPAELLHIPAIGAWAGLPAFLFKLDLVASVFSLPDHSVAAKEPRGHEVGGHDSAAARADRPPPCRFKQTILPAGCALPRYVLRPFRRSKDE